MSEVTIKSKVVLKDLGEPKTLVLQPETTRQLLMGTIIGIANDIKVGKMPDGMSEYKGLKGSFEAVPANPELPTIRSGVLLLGEAFQADIVNYIEQGADQVNFAFEVYVVRASNPQGYSWALKPLLKAEENDPLSMLKAQVAQAALPAPVEGSEELVMPEKAAAKK